MKNILFFIFLLLYSTISANIPEEADVVIVFVLDHFPFYYLTRHQHLLKAGGFKRFTQEGIFYTKAYHAHGIPETSPGHASMSTGTFPVDHGVVNNQWYEQEAKTEFSTDIDPQASVINVPESTIGRSPHHLEVDTVSDQMGIHQATKHMYKAFSVGIKATATIATAGHRTPAYWFNRSQGGFTSSRHYMKDLPKWVKNFNVQSGIKILKQSAWPLCYDRGHEAYQFPFIDNYEYAGLPFSLAGNQEILIDHTLDDPYGLFLRTPAATQLVFDFALDCLKNNYKQEEHEKLLLWVCLSPLDLMCHMYGPDSLEAVDFLHHIDRQLSKAMANIEAHLSTKKVCFVLTADHGMQPLQEISRKRGISTARRIDAKELMNRINQQIDTTYNVPHFLAHFESSYFIYDKDAVNTLTMQDHFEDAEKLVKSLLAQEPGIKRAWTHNELKNIQAQPFSHEQFYKNHVVAGRLGDLIVQPKPYCLVSNYKTGCSHNTPYEYDTHVPLGFYYKGIKPKKIRRNVFVAQLAPTIAQILDIPAPSASLLEPLPHLLSAGEQS